MEATSVSTDGLMDKKDIYIFSGILLCCCCLVTKLSLRAQAAAMAHRARPRGATPRPGSGAEAGRTPCPRGSSQEELPHDRGQGQRPRAPGCDSAGTTERSYPTSEVRGSGREEKPHLQGVVAARAQEGLEELFHVKVRGAAVRRSPHQR